MKGNLIIISSPSGGGKGTLIKEVRSMLPDLGYSVLAYDAAEAFWRGRRARIFLCDKGRF